MAVDEISEAETPLIDDDIIRGSVDFSGLPARRSKSGSWKSATFIIGVEVAERFAYYGISSNLISYLTGPLGQSTATAAENVNAWNGAAMLLPLLGAFVADSFWGRYRTIIIASLVYVLGLGLLSLSAALDSLNSKNNANKNSASPLQVTIFFISLYLVALAQGGHKPCVQAFGADQFDEHDEKELKAKHSFFNWWYFSMNGGILVALLVVNYIQENLSWELGFGIPCIVMCFALIIFLMGSTTYRFRMNTDQRNPFVRIGRVFVSAATNWKETKYKFLDKDENALRDVADAKAILRLVPIWSSCLVYAIVSSQISTLFTKQGATMDRRITNGGFKIPSASLQSLISVSIITFIPIYDRVLVPVARSITKKPAGISMLQRIGTGVFLSFASMVIAALVEKKRLATAVEHGLVDELVVPMSVWWLAPQYIVFGVADVFTMVGLQEFFYDQIPSELKSIGLALYLSIFGVGSFLSSFLISFIQKLSGGGGGGGGGWFSDNLNRGHLDYFYWLLAGLSGVTLGVYVWFAKSYVYYRKD